MLGDLLKRLGALLFTLLSMALAVLAILYLLPAAHKARTASSPRLPESPHAPSSGACYDVQARKSPQDPWYGEIVSTLAPGERFLIPRNLAQKKGAGQTLLTMQYDGKEVAKIAFGTDDVPYFVNAFFVDFSPEPIRHVWEAQRKLRLRLRYELDSRHFPGRREVWQTSAQTFRSLRGDCEDLAIFLADWLATQGYDARVAVGTHGRDGHAWVVLFLKGQTFLIEATSRRPARFYPLAAMLPKYHPVAMFNRDTFWVNTGSPLTTDYVGKRWRKRSTFVRFPEPVRFFAP